MQIENVPNVFENRNYNKNPKIFSSFKEIEINLFNTTII